jgi:hypothetical protein
MGFGGISRVRCLVIMPAYMPFGPLQYCNRQNSKVRRTTWTRLRCPHTLVCQQAGGNIFVSYYQSRPATVPSRLKRDTSGLKLPLNV